MAFGKRNMSYIHYSVLTIIKKGVKVCQDAQMKGESFFAHMILSNLIVVF